jgi:hypothetical protein
LFLIPTAGVSFFFCAWLAMIFWGIVAPKLDIITISYPMAMLITIAVWLIISPLIAAISKRQK